MRYLLLVAVLVFCASCADDDQSCEFGETEVKCLEDFGCTNTAYLLSIHSSNEFELIRNQEEYDAMIDGSCNAQIDWNNYDLIVGMVGLTQGLEKIEKSLFNDCVLNQFRVTFTISLNQTTAAPQISYNAIIPKLGIDENVFVEVIINS